MASETLISTQGTRDEGVRTTRVPALAGIVGPIMFGLFIMSLTFL